MSNGARIGLLVATTAALVLAFVLLAPGDDAPETATAPTAPATTTTPASPADDPAQTTTAVTPPPAPAFETIRVRNAKPVGGVQTVTVKRGDRVRLQVTSSNTSDEIHLHGYDKYGDVAPGRSARFSFEADAEGIFEIELHGTGTQIGKLVVEP